MPDAKPKLKLAFAMGGGVSLGAYSGSALTEAIKLALLRIAEDGTDYDKVVIDVFSGASAGSLSLALMLRALTWRTQAEEDAAKKKLHDSYPDLELDQIDGELRKDLVAAQVAQDLQCQAWVEIIDLDELLGGGVRSRQEALKHAPGILDSEAVYRVARELLLPEGKENIIWGERRLLADRCLYACTLTSLTPFVADATSAFAAAEEALPGLRDALQSRLHKDLRVFDLLFTRKLSKEEAQRSEQAQDTFLTAVERLADASVRVMTALEKNDAPAKEDEAMLEKPWPRAPDLPPRWFRLHDGKSEEGVAWNFQEQRTWAVIAATAIASGAFPGAFAPAVLKRFSWEYGWAETYGADTKKRSIWPAALKATGATKHPFAYTDGGVFNNEPVREAYRMVSFVDESEDAPYVRRVLFVDPAVGPEEEPFGVPTLVETGSGRARWFNLGSPNAGERRTTLPRLLALVGNLVGLLVHQGRTREGDGFLATRDDVQARRDFRKSVPSLMQQADDELARKLWTALSAGCRVFLRNRAGDLIPPGDGNQTGELRRVLRELELGHLVAQVDAYNSEGFANPIILQNKADWLRAHLAVYFDLALGLEGTREDARLIAITPYQSDGSDKPVPLKLLGDPISAFAGFMSPHARRHDFNAGRYCAGFFLGIERKSLALAPTRQPKWFATVPTKRDPERVQYEADLRKGVQQLYARVAEILKSGTHPLLAGPLLALFDVDALLQNQIADIAEERFNDRPFPTDLRRGIEFVILAPEDVELELDAPGVRDADSALRPMVFGGKTRPALATWAEFDDRRDGRQGGWTGGAVQSGNRLLVDKPGWMNGTWAIVEMPSKTQWEGLVKKARTHLRPIAFLNLTENPPRNEGEVIKGSKWDIDEAATPLVHHLLAQAGG